MNWRPKKLPAKARKSRSFYLYSESSEYSDWMGDQGINLQPPKRSQRKTKKKKKKKKVVSTSDDEDDDDDAEGSDLTKDYQKRKKKPAQKKKGRAKKVSLSTQWFSLG